MTKSRVKRIIICFAIFIALVAVYRLGIVENRTVKISEDEIEDLYIEVISLDEKSVEKVEMEKKDVDIIKKNIIGKEILTDQGFVFAEGGYRIVLKTKKEVINFYPYCGSAMQIRVRDDGNDFLCIEESEEKELQCIFDKYGSGRDGIWDWSNI